jgi:hypothetical protein
MLNGGYDPGAVRHAGKHELHESDYNLLLAKDIRDILEQDGYCAVLTRDTPHLDAIDRTADNKGSIMAQRRGAIARNAIALVSIHQDVRLGGAAGIRVNYGNNGLVSDFDFARALATGMGGGAKAVLNDRGLAITNRDNFSENIATPSTGLGAAFAGKTFHMFVAVVETTAFNSGDSRNVVDSKRRWKIAMRAAKGLEATSSVWAEAVRPAVRLNIPTRGEDIALAQR